ncbi:MAG TPA: hypothetical protein VKV80_12540 [Streptosporangiaceae bacterium]|nr:hypothetical protein [Streptosporangiaceae bacterium]
MSVLLLSAATMSCAAVAGVSTPAGAAVAGRAAVGVAPAAHLGCGHPAGSRSGGPPDTPAGPDPASGGDGAAPVVTSARPDTALTMEWRHYGDTSGPGGWAGADGTYSTPLPGGCDAWLFNDTFLGPVNADESLPASAPFIHNSLVLASRRSRRLLATVTGGTPGHPQSLVGPTPPGDSPAGTDSHWYWDTDGIVDHGKLYVFEAEIGPTSAPPPFNFGQTGMKIAAFSLPGLRLQSLTPTYGGPAISWGVQLLRQGPWIYIYGDESAYLNKYVHLARARAGHLLGPWQFYTGTGWSSDPASSARLLGGVGASYSVTPVDGHYVLATTDPFLDPQIYLYTAPSPAGPFTGKQEIYTAPQAGGDIYVYNVAAHPELTGPGQLVLSYNVNSFKLADLYANINNNRARFLCVTFARPSRTVTSPPQRPRRSAQADCGSRPDTSGRPGA